MDTQSVHGLFTKELASLYASDVTNAGGKASRLGDVIRLGLDVPMGFVITTAGFNYFLSANKLLSLSKQILASSYCNARDLSEASARITPLIESCSFPEDLSSEIHARYEKLGSPLVAVRSSAAVEDGIRAAWAGQLKTSLNCTRPRIIERVRSVWASLFAPHALSYRREMASSDTDISLAVLIQSMVASDVSGTAFSVHPATRNAEQIVIEAAFGLGEALVSGAISPDCYVYDKASLSLVHASINTQDKALLGLTGGETEWNYLMRREGTRRKLTEDQGLRLAAVVKLLEDHFDFPVDIEWAWANHRFWILQVRPVTVR